MKTTVGDLNVNFDKYMVPYGDMDKRRSIGFTIGKGKILFWYIVPQTDAFNAYPIEIKKHYMRRIKPKTEITIHYNF